MIARQVFVALYAGLKTQSITLPGFPSSVHNILKTTTQYEPSTIATMLDVVLIQPDERLVNFDTITKGVIIHYIFIIFNVHYFKFVCLYFK